MKNFPDRLQCALRYSHQSYFLNLPVGGNLTQFQMRGNSCHDPYWHLGGHQPWGWDFLKQQYQYYRVHGSSISAKIVPQSLQFNPEAGVVGYDKQAHYLAIIPMSNATSKMQSDPQTMGDIAEIPYSKMKRFTTIGGGRALKHYMTTAKVLGLTKTEAKVSPFTGSSVDTNPQAGWNWHIYCQNNEPNWATYATIQLKITYYVTLFGRTADSGPSVFTTDEEYPPISMEDPVIASYPIGAHPVIQPSLRVQNANENLYTYSGAPSVVADDFLTAPASPADKVPS